MTNQPLQSPSLDALQLLQLLASASIILLLMLPQADAGLQCLDADGQPLDWFTMLKQPNSVEYAYVSSISPDTWIRPNSADLRTSGPLYMTLSQVLAPTPPSADVLAAYNDELPSGGESSSFGHMKGVVALVAGDSGFWLIHSVPKFPDFNLTSFIYPDTGIKYGQSFLCISVSSSDAAEAIGSQLFTSHPNFYKLDATPTARANWPYWDDLANRKLPPASRLNTSEKLVTPAGLQVLHVAKSHFLHQDLYSDVLTSQIESSIKVESWRHGPNLLNSTCRTRYNVTTILEVRIAKMTDFPSISDHSKWCVGAGSKPIVCIGDMNRAVSQSKRGGGIACLSLPGLHRLFKAAVLSEESCDQSTPTGELEEQLLILFYQILFSILFAVLGTVVIIVLLTWFTVKKFLRRYQHL